MNGRILWSGNIPDRVAYYIRESEKMITCEGLEEHTICGTRFRTEQDKFDFQEKHCYKNCERCKHGKMLDESYGN